MKKKRMNPILKKELRIGSRSIKTSMAIMGVNIGLSIIVFIVMASVSATSALYGYNYRTLVGIFPALAITECIVVAFLVPVMASGSISGERERQTLDIMLTTPMKTFSIALGKLESVVVIVMMYLISAMPIMAVAFVLGGLSWSNLFWQTLLMLYLAVYSGSIGIWCSSLVKKSIGATVLTFLIEMAVIFLTTVVFLTVMTVMEVTAYNQGKVLEVSWQPLILTLNPIIPFVEFVLQATTGGGLADLLENMDVSNGWVTFYRVWIPIAGVLNLGVAVGFLKLAARSIGVTHNKKSKR